MSGAFEFVFEPTASLAVVEQTFHLVLAAAEGVGGQARTRTHVRYLLDHAGHRLFVESNTRGERWIALIFAGFLFSEFGEGAFCMREINSFPTLHPLAKGSEYEV